MLLTSKIKPLIYLSFRNGREQNSKTLDNIVKFIRWLSVANDLGNHWISNSNSWFGSSISTAPCK